ncbi:hypothetical protein BMS3Abin05_00183 [bacterium BMS3Abin05]|nr:hypothetical protein BMS3Abin05_00183 [bacterium BMS3Abin05]GBE27425.1 hypothetical protein BMS3Bbin03_01350 [bacterium BMS3Bbin03]HDK35439.1 hypothetical protein [Bacteroidota bacterium]HDZ12570.1 hypothetical protein [Bacteroidota bacterium]
MVKIVVDVGRGIIAVGGELHADAEEVLLEAGSKQGDLWGANYYPWNPPELRIEFTALINIRPHDDNPTMEIINFEIRKRIQSLVENLLLGRDEELV